MKNLFVLFFLASTVSLFSQEFDGTYKVTYVTVEGDGIPASGALALKWYATIKGDEVVMYDSKNMKNSVYTETIGTVTEGDTRKRVQITSIGNGDYALMITMVDDFTKRVTTSNYLMKKQ